MADFNSNYDWTYSVYFSDGSCQWWIKTHNCHLLSIKPSSKPMTKFLNWLRLSEAYVSVNQPSLVQHVALLAPSHYLNQCWNIVNRTHGNTLQWNLNGNLYIFIQENTFENGDLQPFCLGLNVLTIHHQENHDHFHVTHKTCVLFHRSESISGICITFIFHRHCHNATCFSWPSPTSHCNWLHLPLIGCQSFHHLGFA